MLCFRNFLSAPSVCTFLDMGPYPGMRDHGMVVLTGKSSELAAQPIFLRGAYFQLIVKPTTQSWVCHCSNGFGPVSQDSQVWRNDGGQKFQK